jgi:putative transposase
VDPSGVLSSTRLEVDTPSCEDGAHGPHGGIPVHGTRRSRADPRGSTPHGARRFAYNCCLEAVKDKLDERRARPDVEVLWSGYSLINWWNGWKRSPDAGRLFAVDPSGRADLVDAGLSWRNEVCAQVFEEAAVDLGRSVAAFSASKKGTRRGGRIGLPHFQKKGQGPESFRLRNKVSPRSRPSIRLGEKGARSISLPVIGAVAVREDTRHLRRMLRPRADGVPRARICSATVSFRQGRIIITLTCELADLHPEMRHRQGPPRSFVGVDRGLSHLVIVAGSDRTEWGRIDPPRHLVQQARPSPGLLVPFLARCPGRPTGPRHALVWGACTGG